MTGVTVVTNSPRVALELALWGKVDDKQRRKKSKSIINCAELLEGYKERGKREYPSREPLCKVGGDLSEDCRFGTRPGCEEQPALGKLRKEQRPCLEAETGWWACGQRGERRAGFARRLWHTPAFSVAAVEEHGQSYPEQRRVSP